MVHLVATGNIPNGKAILVINSDVTISNFEFSGAQVVDGNGAGIRYQAGNLTLNNCYFHDNQEGLLATDNPAGSITINASEFAHNGVGDPAAAGYGLTHNIYVGHIAALTITGSYFHDAVVGHEIKSRALATTIQDSRIVDGTAGTASYSIDLPNGGDRHHQEQRHRAGTAFAEPGDHRIRRGGLAQPQLEPSGHRQYHPQRPQLPFIACRQQSDADERADQRQPVLRPDHRADRRGTEPAVGQRAAGQRAGPRRLPSLERQPGPDQPDRHRHGDGDGRQRRLDLRRLAGQCRRRLPSLVRRHHFPPYRPLRPAMLSASSCRTPIDRACGHEITFGEVFAPGQVPQGGHLVAVINGVQIPVQLDVKTTNADGSVKMGISRWMRRRSRQTPR